MRSEASKTLSILCPAQAYPTPVFRFVDFPPSIVAYSEIQSTEIAKFTQISENFLPSKALSFSRCFTSSSIIHFQSRFRRLPQSYRILMRGRYLFRSMHHSPSSVPLKDIPPQALGSFRSWKLFKYLERISIFCAVSDKNLNILLLLRFRTDIVDPTEAFCHRRSTFASSASNFVCSALPCTGISGAELQVQY